MNIKLRQLNWPLIALAAVLGISLSQLPLFKDLGYESAFITALILPLTLGLYWIKSAADCEVESLHHAVFIKTLNSLLAFFLVPILQILLTFGNQCDIAEGLVWYIMAVGFGSIFSISLSLFIGSFNFRSPKLIFTTLSLLILLFHPLIAFWTSPQIFFFNHFFGFFAGSIYDEAIQLEPRYFLFRGETTLFSIALILISYRKRSSKFLPTALLFLIIAGGITFYHSAMRISSNYDLIENQLSAVAEGKYWYASKVLSESDKKGIETRIARELKSLQSELSLNELPPIKIYIYKDAEEKKQFTGAEETEFTKIWRKEIHITRQGFESTIRHELVHILMGEYGLSLFGGSISIGLIEGIAVAFETPSEEWTLDELSSALFATGLAPKEPQSLIGVFGFWGGQSSTSYTLMGSFVKYLIEREGIEKFKCVYARANFKEVYGKSESVLFEEWMAFLKTIQYPVELNAYLRYVFERQSIFQAKCPHQVARKLKDARRLSAENAFREAKQRFEEIIAVSGRSRNAAVQGLLTNELRRINTVYLSDSSKEYEAILLSEAVQSEFRDLFNTIVSLTVGQKKQEPIQYQLALAMLWSRGDKRKIDSLFQLVFEQHLSTSYDIAAIVGKEINQRFTSAFWLNPYLKTLDSLTTYKTLINALYATPKSDFTTFVISKIALERRKPILDSTAALKEIIANEIYETQFNELTSNQALIRMAWFRLKFERSFLSGNSAMIEKSAKEYVKSIEHHSTRNAKKRWVNHQLKLLEVREIKNE